MIKKFGAAVLLWLAVLELLAGWRGWRGMAWLRRGGLGRLLAALMLLAGWRGLPGRRGWRAFWLVLAAPIALAVQVAAASLRNRALNPLARLRPGAHTDRFVIDLHITMAEGYLPAIEIAPAAGATAAVALLHGSGDQKTAYTWWIVDALLARGIATLLVDLDGHGANPRPQRFPQILEDATVAVGWLRERYARVGLLGISLGGCIAARAVADGAAADALVVLEAPPQLHYTRADMWREALELRRSHVLAIFQDSTAYDIARAWTTTPIRAAISTWDLIAALDLLGSLPRICVPLLALYGANDAIVKPAQALQVRAALPPGATFELVPSASHLTLFLRRDIQETIAAWFQQQLS